MNDLINKLPAEEISLIDSYRKYSAPGEEDSFDAEASAPIDYVLRFWDKNKASLYKALGERFIVSIPVEYEKSPSQLEDIWWNEFRWDDFPCLEKVKEYTYGLEDYWMRCSRLCNAMFDTRNIIANALPAESTFMNSVTFPNGKEIKIDKKMKLMKIIKKFYENLDMNMEEYERFRILQSQICNTKKIKGEFCLSIHPLDYMTMSDNAEDWSSCMSWVEDGCYRQGTIEMMNSPCVVVGYLKSDRSYNWGGTYDHYTGSWNSKKWRCLYILDKDIITSVKAYPYFHEELIKVGVDLLKDLAQKNLGWQYGDKLTVFDGSTNELRNKADSNETFCFSTNLMYNDFGTTASFGYYNLDCKGKAIYYSGESECMGCGCLLDGCDYEGRETCVLCDMCRNRFENMEYCTICDGRVFSDPYWVDDEPLCEYCFENETVWAAIEGCRHFRDSVNLIYLKDTKDVTEYSAKNYARFEEDIYVTDYELSKYFPEGLEDGDTVELSQLSKQTIYILWADCGFFSKDTYETIIKNLDSKTRSEVEEMS